MKKESISVVINTYNEEKNLPLALKSVFTWAKEIIVVDMYSEDKTREIAESYGAKVFLYENVGFSEPARAFAVNQATNEWILILDADEIVSFLLANKLIEIYKENILDVIEIPRLNYMIGEKINYTGWGEDFQVRFFRKNALKFTEKIHDFIKYANNIKKMRLERSSGQYILHFNYIDFNHFIEKLNRYTNIEASQAFEKNQKSTVIKAIFKAFSQFFYYFFLKKGYKDGWRGFYLSILMFMYKILQYAKLKELYETGGRQKVIEKYCDTALKEISKYDENN